MIRRLVDVADREAARRAVVDIFFASAARTSFTDEDERRRFLDRWTGWYLSAGVEWVRLAIGADGQIEGYLTGCPDSAAATALFDTIPRYRLFADLFPRFPAHLHVNVAPIARGRGVGAELVNAFAGEVGAGVHVVTGPGARNVGFYARNGFSERVEREGLLFLGRPLT